LLGDFVFLAAALSVVTLSVVTFDDLEPDDFDFKAIPLQWDGWLLPTVAE
jgi:hypothetical protein